MASPRRVTDTRHRTTAGARLRLLARLLAVLGGLVAPAGAAVLVARGESVPPLEPLTVRGVQDWATAFLPLAAENLGVGLLVGGVAALALWALVELVAVVFLSTSRRSAVGLNTGLQLVLAVVALVTVNAASREYFERFDLTRDKRFTLAPELVAELKQLRADSPTTVVVLQLKKSGPFAGEPDATDTAAEAVTVEKVQDLVSQLREFGPQFRVEVLDRKDVDFDKSLAAVTARRPGLAAAIAAAPESSLFFYADEKVTESAAGLAYPAAVTRMGFSEFYQLDKVASQEAPGGNLVLLPRGPAAFVRKVLAIEERRPRIGLAVIHPLLTTRDTVDEYTASGLRDALERNGFEVVDIILKKWSRTGPPTPDATTYEETDLDRAEARYSLLTNAAASREQAIAVFTAVLAEADKNLALADKSPPEERGGHLVAAARAFTPVIRGRIQSEADLLRVRATVAGQVPLLQSDLTELAAKAAEAGAKYQDKLKNDRAAEGRRVTDVRAKFAAAAADCDALIVPRLTVTDISRGAEGIIPGAVFNLAADQADVVKDYLKLGKPVLFAVGPPVTDPGRPGPPEADDIERLIAELGIRAGRQTILTDDEVTAIAENQGLAFGGGAGVKVPVRYDRPPPAGKAANPVADALRVVGRSAAGGALEIKQGAFRPVTASAALRASLPYPPEFLFTPPASFNEDKPVADGDYLPKFDPAPADDPRRGTPEEERRDSFAVAVAAEVPAPAAWGDVPGVSRRGEALAGVIGAGLPSVGKPTAAGVVAAAALAGRFDGGLLAAAATTADALAPRDPVRVVVIGHAGLFVGKRLDPGPETLLVSCLNWQLKRTDRLAAATPDVWTYPRVNLDAASVTLWRWGAAAYLPAAVFVLGLAALMLRRRR